MAYKDYKDNRFEELKNIESDIRKSVIANLEEFPDIYSEVHVEKNSIYRRPKAVLTITVEVDVTDMELIERDGKWYVKKR